MKQADSPTYRMGDRGSVDKRPHPYFGGSRGSRSSNHSISLRLLKMRNMRAPTNVRHTMQTHSDASLMHLPEMTYSTMDDRSRAVLGRYFRDHVDPCPGFAVQAPEAIGSLQVPQCDDARQRRRVKLARELSSSGVDFVDRSCYTAPRHERHERSNQEADGRNRLG